MRDLNEKEIVDALRDEPAPPPAGLEQRLKDQIPAELFEGEGRGSGRGWTGRPWLAAAAALVVVFGTVVVSRTLLGPDLGVESLVDRLAAPSQNRAIAPAIESTSAVADADLTGTEAVPRSLSPVEPVGDERQGAVGRSRDSTETVYSFEDDQFKGDVRGALDVDKKRSPASPPPATPGELRGDRENELVTGLVTYSEDGKLRVRREVLEIPEAQARETHWRQVQALEAQKLELEEQMVVLRPGDSRQIAVTAEAPQLLELRRPNVSAGAASSDSRLRALGYVGDAPESVRRQQAASTGGTREPNDQPYGDTFFRSAGVNPFIDTDDDPLSTFGVDVDTASYAVTRSYLERGHLPPPESVRVEEFLNSFDYRDPAPRRGDFAIHADGAPTPFSEGPLYRLVRFGIVGREVESARRKPAALTFLVDVSGSMRRQNRLGSVRQSLLRLLDQLLPGDRVGLVIYGDAARVLLESTSDLGSIRRAIDNLRPGGSTNLEHGLRLAYDVAGRAFDPTAVNRIILCSDGVANVGVTSAGALLRSVADGLARGVEISTVGFGMDNYNDILMEKLADSGNGNYFYVDSWQEAEQVFVENLTGMLQTIGRDAKIQVEFNPLTVSRYRLLGYENRDVADDRFRDPGVDAGEIGAGHRVTALYEIKLQPAVKSRQVVATLRLRYENDAGRTEELEHRLDVGDLSDRWERGSDALRLAAVVAELAEILKHSYWARDAQMGALIQQADSLRQSGDYRGDEAVEELVRLTRIAARLQPAVSPSGEELRRELERKRDALDEQIRRLDE